MTSQKEWFYKYEPISREFVYMGDDHALKIVGIGTIKIKIFDGTVCTIEDAKGLKKNILYLGQIDSYWCKTHVENGIIKIARGALVLMKGGRSVLINSYLKNKHLINVDAFVASNIEDSTMMWHFKLGHMLEQDLKILSEWKLLLKLKSVNLPFCKYCVTSKQYRLKYNISIVRSKCIQDLVHFYV